MHRKLLLFAALSFAGVVCAPAAFAEDEEAPAEESAPNRWHRSSYGGLGGYGTMVSSDPLPSSLGIRSEFQFQTSVMEMDLVDGALDLNLYAQVYRLKAAVALAEMVEVALSVPIIDYELQSNFLRNEGDAGFGNPEVSAKIIAPIGLEFLSIGAYTKLQLPWGERDIIRPRRFPFEEGKFAEWELGMMASINIAGLASIDGNLAFRDIETGIQTLVYRIGASVHPIDMIAAHIYWDFEEYEGAVRTSGFFGYGVHIYVNEMVTIGAGGEVLVEDNAARDILRSGLGGGAVSTDDEFDYLSFHLQLAISF